MPPQQIRQNEFSSSFPPQSRISFVLRAARVSGEFPGFSLGNTESSVPPSRLPLIPSDRMLYNDCHPNSVT
ncbi:hypothetical protein RRG08_053045 [Elysia crispata]|uniref:Uncharacterized protein n=1 Tax=Elysia crispata TaxID=231223 RepID=A0AAE0XTU9_9GAST|nr:hypothetical protein RRG08_053045 [Elysia crispata]